MSKAGTHGYGWTAGQTDQTEDDDVKLRVSHWFFPRGTPRPG